MGLPGARTVEKYRLGTSPRVQRMEDEKQTLRNVELVQDEEAGTMADALREAAGRGGGERDCGGGGEHVPVGDGEERLSGVSCK